MELVNDTQVGTYPFGGHNIADAQRGSNGGSIRGSRPAILLLQQQLARQQADHAAALIAIRAQMAAQAVSLGVALATVPAAAAVRVVDPAVRVLLDELSASTVRPARMSLLVHLCPELEAEDPETLVGPRATLELLQARVFLLKNILTAWQNFVALVDPSFVTTDFQGLGGGHATAGAGARMMPVARGATTTALAMVPKTPTKPELFRLRESDIEAAVRGDPVSKEAAQFTSGGSLLTRLASVVPSGGLHKGVDLRVRPFRNYAEDDEPRWELGLDGKSRLHLKTKWAEEVGIEVPEVDRGCREDTSAASLESAGTSVHQWHEFIAELRDVGVLVLNMTANACRMAVAFKTDPDKIFQVRGAACGVRIFIQRGAGGHLLHSGELRPAEHRATMDKEIRKDRDAGNIVMVKMVWNIQGISVVGVVAKEWKGVLKFMPVWDYSRPEDVGANSRIDLEKEKFSSIKDAYALLRPGLWMAKLNLTSAYRSVPVAAMYWIAHVFEWDEEGASVVGYLDDFLSVGRKRVVLEFLKLLREFVVFLGFEVNDDKCEGPFHYIEFLGILLSTEGNQCTASISEDRIAVVQEKIANIRRLGALPGCQVPRIPLEGLLGLLAFCGQVVYGLSLHTRYAHTLLAQARGRYLYLTDKVEQDLKMIVTVIRLLYGRKIRLDRVEEHYFPFRPDCPESWDIGYLELFTVFWAMVLWGKYITGKTVVIRIDNNCVIVQVEKWWGPAAYIPLLWQLFFVCVQHDVPLRPVYISSEDNIYSDLLSRDRVEEFGTRFEADKQKPVWIEDRDDWMLSGLDQGGQCAGHGLRQPQRLGNPPFSGFIDIVRREQQGTSATFLVPWWPGNPGFKLVVSLPGVFKIVRRTVTLQAECFALNTHTAYSTGVRSWVSFCISGRARGFLNKMLPAEDEMLADWVVYMVTERAGRERRWDTPSKQVMPLGFVELLLVAEVVNPHNFNENVVFAAMDMACFCFFRKDNVSVEKAEAWNPREHLVQSDVTFPDVTSADIRVRHSKTIQDRERYHHVRVLYIPGSPICPLTPLRLVMAGPTLGEDGLLFCIEDARGRLKPLTHSFFVGTFRKLAERVGSDPTAYSGHSFRRCGATAAYGLKVADHLIQAHGDWTSDCYKLYCDLGREQLLLLPSAMADGAAAATAAHRASR
ncbi:hypothetical protein CYMTET_52784 [Cymbomonas tetramitiformis]|uniref:Reverse transcriptase domain-containing protein n=1 Tax=Cymbomonas tetramitiformis TaxID=36881 RepID=A0AAE0BIB0_9CHLO|nr:hypothetical protein CYMTET_52784 [Cymbomonas tetramitiformis]